MVLYTVAYTLHNQSCTFTCSIGIWPKGQHLTVITLEFFVIMSVSAFLCAQTQREASIPVIVISSIDVYCGNSTRAMFIALVIYY